MIFLFSCISTHLVLKTSLPTLETQPNIDEKELPLQYDTVKTRAAKQEEADVLSLLSTTSSEDPWTLSPYPKPSTLQTPSVHSISYPVTTSSVPALESPITVLSMHSEDQKPQLAFGEAAQISGPHERISSDMIILRTQFQQSNGGNLVQWTNTISPAPCPVQFDGFVCTPPQYNISYSSAHISTLDSFDYTQFSFSVSEIPVPIYVHSTIQNTKKESLHQTLIHPASIYVGLSAPYWSELLLPLEVHTQIKQTNGSLGSAQSISTQLIGSSRVQTCTQEKCSFLPDRTGWHQLISTATDVYGKQTQSSAFVFIYGKNLGEQAEVLLHPEKKTLLVQGGKSDTDLMLGYLAAEEIFLDSHSMNKGFLIAESTHPIEKAKVLLLGKEKNEFSITPEAQQEETDINSDSSALFFANIEISYLPNLWLYDKSALHILLPAGEGFAMEISSQNNNISVAQKLLYIEDRKSPSLLRIPIEAVQLGADVLTLRTKNNTKDLPITVRASIAQPPTIHMGMLSAHSAGAGTSFQIPQGHFSIATDTHAEHRLLPYILPYLYIVPTINNRMKRIQIASQAWDALFHSGESYSWSLLEKTTADSTYIQDNWQRLSDEELLQWLYTIVVMNQSALYVPTHHVVEVYEAIQKKTYAPKDKAFLFFIIASAENTPLKGILSLPSTQEIKDLFNILQDEDRIWLIPALEKDTSTKHWTYSNYETLIKTNAERIMLVFFRMREYRYRIPNLRNIVSKESHLGLLAQLQHARDRRLNRYSIHAFLWDAQELLLRGGHRRRAHHPIAQQGYSEQQQTLTLTAKGDGELRYTMSWRPPKMTSTPAKGTFVTQKITTEGNEQLLHILFDVPQEGAVWIHAQLPSPVQINTTQEAWIEEIEKQNQELLIKTKALAIGRYHITIPMYMHTEGQYHIPPVIIGQGETWLGQSESGTLTVP